ncbi:MAG: MATE family efflux transporter [Candidatus Eremiobacteraeota bacterium]|nr:MATE family efflux transporter [Candidatus Eremiobacteraeota bacterium]
MTSASGRGHLLDDPRPVWRVLFIFLIPLMLSNLLQGLSSTASAIYLGRLIGVHALAAVSAIFPIIFLLVSFIIGLASGSTVLIGQAYGARDNDKLKTIAGTTLTLTVLLSIVVGGLGGLLAEPLLSALGTPADILPASASYCRIVFYTMPVLFVYLIYTTFLRGTGDAKTPMYALVLSTILILAITPFFILGWLGLPKLGINGAAVANVVANVLSLGAMLAYLARIKHPLAFDGAMLRHLRIDWPLAWTITRIGVPTGLNLIMVSLSEIAVLSFVNRFGSTATAAYGAVNQIVSYVQFPAISIGIAVSIFGSQAIGAQRLERIPQIVRSGVVLNYAIEGVLIGIVYLFSYHVISLFIIEPATAAIAQRLLHITLWSYVIFGNARVLSGLMLSSGAVVWPTLISIASIWAVEVPVAYVLMKRIGLDGVWYGYPAAFIAGLLMQLTYYKLFWKKRPLRRLV